jgi:hypothetical protein
MADDEQPPSQNLLGQRIKVLLDQWILSAGTAEIGNSLINDTAKAVAIEALGLGIHSIDVWDLRALVAFQVAPRSAINYESTNPTPRWRLVQQHIHKVTGLELSECEELARSVAAVINRVGTRRIGLHDHLDLLLQRDGPRCNYCLFPFSSSIAPSIRSRDPFKPMYESPEELCQPEVDHIVPVSRAGENDLSNLQILCRGCNMAKSDLIALLVKNELLYAGLELREIPRPVRFRMLVWALLKSGSECSCCQDSETELTVRLWQREGAYVRTNMRVLCYPCALASE